MSCHNGNLFFILLSAYKQTLQSKTNEKHSNRYTLNYNLLEGKSILMACKQMYRTLEIYAFLCNFLPIASGITLTNFLREYCKFNIPKQKEKGVS